MNSSLITLHQERPVVRAASAAASRQRERPPPADPLTFGSFIFAGRRARGKDARTAVNDWHTARCVCKDSEESGKRGRGRRGRGQQRPGARGGGRPTRAPLRATEGVGRRVRRASGQGGDGPVVRAGVRGGGPARRGPAAGPVRGGVTTGATTGTAPRALRWVRGCTEGSTTGVASRWGRGRGKRTHSGPARHNKAHGNHFKDFCATVLSSTSLFLLPHCFVSRSLQLQRTQ